MKITSIELQGVKGFRQLDKLKFSQKINILVGPNNSGKSTILSSIFSIQRAHVLSPNDVTIGQSKSSIELDFINGRFPNLPPNQTGSLVININSTDQMRLRSTTLGERMIPRIPEKEPTNIIFPFLSKRKVAAYSDEINESAANSVNGDLRFLNAKIDRLVVPQFPGHDEYIKVCREILGFEISTIPKANGKQAVQFVHKREHIPVSLMGDGVANILGLVTDLCVAEGNIFLIEEPENDIHPKALKALLGLIATKSEANQFFISTHSNIVIKNLGGVDGAKIFSLSKKDSDVERPGLSLSTMKEISGDPEDRIKLLEELGYELFDFDLWKAWLFFEESSAEVIVRDYLIRWFVPKLINKLKTFSAGTVNKVQSKFEDFNKLFVFLHLEPSYKNRVWVYIDAGENEKKIVDKMKEVYTKSGWSESAFNQFNEHDFEKYYPTEFQERVTSILNSNKDEKPKLKKELLDNLKLWISEDESKAKSEFEKSAAEVIDVLKEIEKKLNQN